MWLPTRAPARCVPTWLVGWKKNTTEKTPFTLQTWRHWLLLLVSVYSIYIHRPSTWRYFVVLHFCFSCCCWLLCMAGLFFFKSSFPCSCFLPRLFGFLHISPYRAVKQEGQWIAQQGRKYTHVGEKRKKTKRAPTARKQKWAIILVLLFAACVSTTK